MSRTESVTVETNAREGFARTCRVQLGTRQFMTPSFIVRLDSGEKLDLYLRLKRQNSKPHLGGFVVRLTDSKRVLGRHIEASSQTNLQGRFVENDFVRSRSEDLIMIDPALENLFYTTHLEDFAFGNLPEQLTSYALEYSAKKDELINDKRALREWVNEKHHVFWDELREDDRKRTRFIRDVLEKEVKLRASVLIPPVPLITNESLFDLTKMINQKSTEVSRLWRECAHSYVFKADALRNQSLMDGLKNSIDESKARLNVFKFKYMNLNEEDRIIERLAFKDLMQSLDLKSRLDANQAFILLEAGSQAFACAGRGFDFISTSFSLDREDRVIRTERSPWGKWYDPRYLTTFDRAMFLQAYANNGNRIPCDCQECLSTTRPEYLGIEDWNRFVKRHYLSRRNKDYAEIADALARGNATPGAIDRLQSSVLKNLVDLVR